MKIVIGVLLLSLASIFIAFAWASFPWRLKPYTAHDEIINKSLVDESLLDPPATMTVLTWNLSFAYGLGSEGTDEYLPQTKEHFEKNLELIAQAISASNADVVVLQEIDFHSSRSHGIDQLKYLLDKTDLKYGARADSWVSNYVPHPLTPLAHHFGKVRSGGAVLSRWPITENKVYLLEKPQSKAWWYNLFYLYRYVQMVTIDVVAEKIKVANVHLEAFDIPNKELHATRVVEIANKEQIDFVMGDFNMLPQGALKKSGFDNPMDDYESDKSFLLLSALPHQEIVEHSSYLQREEAWFTFPSNKPDRRLDYIFHLKSWPLISAEIYRPLKAEVSDHLPIKAIFKLFDPKFIRD
jgi:endonuclease/exonuclease/phosphatase family metal-dependent hydrolase